MADLAQSSWSEIDALNNQAAPLGWTPGVMLPTGVEPTAQAMMGAMKRWWNRQNPIYAATLTTTDTYTVSPQTPVTSFTSFELWRVRMPSANTSTSPTITWGPSPAPIQKYNNGALVNLAIGDIQAQYYEFFFNNTVMVMINPAAQTSVTGPASSTIGDLASYADGTGKVIADSGLAKAFIVKNAVSSTSQSIPVFTDTSGTVIGNGFLVGNAANDIVQLDSSARLPAVDGSQLTNLSAAVDNTTRRNILLDLAGVAKAMATSRRALQAFADGFGDSSGINGAASSNYVVSGVGDASGVKPTTLQPTSTNIGTANSTTGATVALGSVTSPAGSTIVVFAGEAGQGTIGSVADTAGNTYLPITSTLQDVSGSGVLGAFYCHNALALNNGTITYTKNLSGSSASISALYLTNVASSSLDTTVTATALGSSTAISVTSGVAQAGDIIVAGVGYGSNAAYVQAAGFSAPPNTSVAGTVETVAGGTLVNSGVGTTTFSTTLGSAVNWGAIIVGFKSSLTPANMTLVTTTQTADANPAIGVRAMLELEGASGLTINTDLAASVSADGGTHWTAATFSLVGTTTIGAGTVRTIWETADTLPGTLSTSIAAKLVSANNKAFTVRSLTMAWH